jgi:WD40 repeat protein
MTESVLSVALSLWVSSAPAPLYWSSHNQILALTDKQLQAFDPELHRQWQIPLRYPATAPFAQGKWVGWLEMRGPSEHPASLRFVLYDRSQKKVRWQRVGISGYALSGPALFLRDQTYIYRLRLSDLTLQRIAMLPQPHQNWVGSELLHHPDGRLLFVNLIRDQYERIPPGYSSYPQIWSLSRDYRHKSRIFKQWGFSSDYGIQGLSLSPNGQWLAFYAGLMGTLHLQHLPSGRVTTPLPETGSLASCAASALDPPLWQSNSQHLYLAPTLEGCPGLVGLQVYPQTLQAYPTYPPLRYAVMSPDRRWLAGLKPQAQDRWQPWIGTAPHN